MRETERILGDYSRESFEACRFRPVPPGPMTREERIESEYDPDDDEPSRKVMELHDDLMEDLAVNGHNRGTGHRFLTIINKWVEEWDY